MGDTNLKAYKRGPFIIKLGRQWKLTEDARVRR